MNAKVLIRGGGDLASGVAARLHRAGFLVLITELPQPLVIRRSVSFAEAVFTGETKVEETHPERQKGEEEDGTPEQKDEELDDMWGGDG